MWFFVRHAESTANLAKLLGGQGDYPLTAAGQEQARLIAAQMKKQFPAVESIVSSPQPRALHTAQIFAVEMNLPSEAIVLENALMEHNIGRFTGMPYTQAQSEPDYQSDVSQRWHWHPPGGESYAEVARRVQRLLYSYQPQRKRVLLFVTHAVTMRLIYAVLSNSLPHYPSEVCHNGEVWECEFLALHLPHQITIHRFPGTSAHRP